MNISCIAAVDCHGAIGRGHTLPWHLPEDFKWFRRQTLGKTIVMGRKTFDSLPSGPLKNRTHWILSRQRPTHSTQNVRYFNALSSMMTAAKAAHLEELMIIGGGEIYALFLPYANRLYLTHVKAHIADADTFFPPIDLSRWRKEQQIDFKEDAHHPFAFSCCFYTAPAQKEWSALIK